MDDRRLSFWLYASQVGDDEFGYMLADILKQNNVNNSGMRFDTTARTALAFVTLRADGEREFLFFRNPSADMLLHESELDISLIKQVHLLLLVGRSVKNFKWKIYTLMCIDCRQGSSTMVQLV